MGRIEYLRPSGAATWTVCTGYPAMIAGYASNNDEGDNDVREDGTAFHWLIAEMAAGRTPALESFSPNGRLLTEEMFDHADEYIDSLGNVSEWRIEQKVSCASIYPGMEGTPDASRLTSQLLQVRDAKYGFRFVEVFGNLQLTIYAWSLLHEAGISDPKFPVELSIFQPRYFGPGGTMRTWRTTAGELYPYIEMLREAAAKAMGPTPMCVPNPGCGDCAARHECAALQRSSYTALELAYAAVPFELSPAAVGSELALLQEARKRIEARITGLETQAEGLLLQGGSVPGYSMRAVYGRERWQDGAAEKILALAPMFGVDVAKPATPVSPAQARKLKLPDHVVAMFSVKPFAGHKLKKDDPLEATKRFNK